MRTLLQPPVNKLPVLFRELGSNRFPYHTDAWKLGKVVLIFVISIRKLHIEKGEGLSDVKFFPSFYPYRRTNRLLYPLFFFRFFADSTASATTGLFSNRLV